MSNPVLEITPEFQQAVDLLNSGASIFLTGRAGTGKSTLIRTFLEQTSRDALVVAPTGIAALNVNGDTIHRLFGFSPRVTPAFVRSKTYAPKRLISVLSTAPILIVDESSMVRADLFDCMVTALERFGPHPDQPFGGIQMVLVGDLFQLPPVVIDAEQTYFTTTYESPFFFSAHKYSAELFQVVELQKVFRQQGDTSLVELLNAVRDGSMDEQQRARLNSLVQEGFTPPIEENWLTLTTSNPIAGSRNNAMLEQLDTPLTVSHAQKFGNIDGFDQPTESELKFKVGAQVMLLNNDPDGSWVNGSIGVIRSVATDPSGEPASVSIQLKGGSVVTVGPHTWEVTAPTVVDGKLRHETIGRFTQLPLKLSWAITIHKSQGQTLDRCVVDLSGGTFADGQLYVALSRCTSLEGLVLTKEIKPRDLKVSQRIRSFLASSGESIRANGTAYIGVCTVGEVSRITRPRPIEIAVVTDSGEEISTLINPGRDIGDARTRYGISASDIILAPTLDEAWHALSPFLAGRTPVGFDIDQVLQDLDYELKRGDMLSMIPVGNNIPPEMSHGAHPSSALERARAARNVDQATPIARTSSDFFPEKHSVDGFLLPRESLTKELVEFFVSSDSDLTDRLAELLRSKASVAVTDKWATEVMLGVEVVSHKTILDSLPGTAPRLSDVIVPGAGICFTGSAVDLAGNPIEREELETLALERGLQIESTVTKSRCKILVSAESGTQSGKAKKAASWGIPVFTAQEFLSFLNGFESAPANAPEPRAVAVLPVPVPAPTPTPGQRIEPQPRSQDQQPTVDHSAINKSPSGSVWRLRLFSRKKNRL